MKIKRITRGSGEVDNDHETSVVARLQQMGVLEAVYWYEYEGYEGSGQCIFKGPNERWYLDSLSHCSCYGPDEHLGMDGDGHLTPDMLFDACSEELRTELQLFRGEL